MHEDAWLPTAQNTAACLGEETAASASASACYPEQGEAGKTEQAGAAC